MSGLLAMGTFFAGFGALCALFLWNSKRNEGKDVWLTAQFTTNELGGIPLSGDVKVFGKLNYSPAGPLQGPMSGQPCLWHRVLVVRHVERQVQRTDDQGNEYWETERQDYTLSDNQSSAYFLLQDQHGYARILPAGVELRGAVASAQQQYQDDSVGYQQLGQFLGQAGVEISSGVQNLLSGLDAIGDMLDNTTSWITMTEYSLAAEHTAVALLQVGQDINDGSRFLYHSGHSDRVSVVELTESLEQYEQGVKDSTSRYGKWAVFFTLVSMLCGAGWYLTTH